MEANLPFLLCFTLYLRYLTFQVQACGAGVGGGGGELGLYLEGRYDLTEDFLRYLFGGLILERLLHGGPYFRNFTVLN